MSKKEKSKDILKDWYNEKLANLLNALAYRIIFLSICFVVFFSLLYFLTPAINTTSILLAQLIIMAYFFVGLYFPLLHIYKSGNQMISEMLFLNSIYKFRKEIDMHRKSSEPVQDYSQIQFRINAIRQNLKSFVEFSKISFPPIFDFELNRFHKRQDIFFNTASEVLFPIPTKFSREVTISEQLTLAYYESQEGPTLEEIEDHFRAVNNDEMGTIDLFDIYGLDEFLQYLGDLLFSKTKRFSPFYHRHSINIILLSKFFEYWNSVLSQCTNCKKEYSKAKSDIEEYYTKIAELRVKKKERRWGLQDRIIIVIISALITAVVSLLTKFVLI